MNGGLTRFLGGPPLWVLTRLVLLSILVGVILAAFGVDALNLWYSVERMIRALQEIGWDAVMSLWRYFLLGAVLVVPIWLVMRLIRTPSRRF